MNELTLLAGAKLILAATFVLAGTKAWTDREAYLAMLADFGAPAALRGPVAGILTALELAIGLALLVPGITQAAALAAFCLLAWYTAVLAYTLIGDRRPRCNCFGQLSGQPISYKTLVRNGVFLVLAAVLVWRGDAPAGIDLPVLAVVAGGVMVLQAWLLLHLLTQNGRLFLRIDTIELQLKAAGFAAWEPESDPARQTGLPIGTLAPDAAVHGALDGKASSLAQLRSQDRPTLLIFSDAACGPCKDMLPQLAQWRRQYGSVLKLIIVTTASDQPASDLYGELADIAYIQNGRDGAAAYDAQATPGAVLVSREGAVASTLALGAAHIATLVHAVAAAEMAPVAPAQQLQPA